MIHRQRLLAAACFAITAALASAPAAAEVSPRLDYEPGEVRAQFDFEHARHLVDLLYRGALFRAPDQQGGRTAQRHIVRYGYQGLLQVAYNIGASAEFERVLWVNGSEAIVHNLYLVWLQREPDTQGYWGWVDALNRGQSADALRSFVGSPEFYQKNIAPW